MTGVQSELYELLKLFDTICKENDVEYFLTGGSALGAIRHNGFIPWDDDIDVGITRPMWNKLKLFIKDKLPSGYYLVDKEEYPTYRNPVVRIVNTHSARITRAALGDGCPKGQFLELFIHDAVPKAAVAEHKKLFGTYCELTSPYLAILQQKFRLKHGLKDDELEIADEYFRIKDKYSESEIQELLLQMEGELGKYSAEESDYYLLGWGASTRYYPIVNYSGIKHVKFEDIELPVPVRVCDLIRSDYRNEWVNYPNVENQTTPHMSVGVPGVSGDEYMRLIAEDISLEETNEMRFALKELNLKGLKEVVCRDKQMINMKMRFAQQTDLRSEDTRDLYRAGKYEVISDRFNQYILLKKHALNYSIDEDIRMDTRELIASSLLMTGRLTDAENVMDIGRTQLPDAENSEFNNDILRLALCATAFYDGFYDEARNMLNMVREDWHNSIIYRKMNARMDMREHLINKDVIKLSEEYPEDPEAIKLLADLKMTEGSKTEAENLYRRVLEKSRNGMDILDIKKRLSL